jgi:hypothetical protein
MPDFMVTFSMQWGVVIGIVWFMLMSISILLLMGSVKSRKHFIGDKEEYDRHVE